MKKHIRKWSLLLTSVILIGSLSGCSDEEKLVKIEESQKEDPVYLSYFTSNGLAGTDIGKYWSERFAKEYGQEVYINYDGASYYGNEGLSYRELLEKRLKSSSPDDLYVIKAEDVLEFEKKGYWMDLSGLECVDNLSEAALYQSTYNGKVFSIPLEFTGFGVCWNVDMLEEHGLGVPENLGQFENVCAVLKEAGIVPYGGNKGYALTVPAMCIGMAELYKEEGKEQRIEELNNGKVSVSTYLRRGYEFLNQMIEKGYLDPNQAMSTIPGDEVKAFQSGKYAFICTGIGNTVFREAESIDFKLEMTGFPVLPEGCIAVYGADSRLCVNPESKNLDTALEFMEMVGDIEALNESAALGQTMSTAKDADDSAAPLVQKKMYELLKQPGQIPNQDFSLHFNTWENIRDVAREICSGSSVDEACAMLDEKQRADLEEYSGE